jgi:uncharacterized membrane protein YedE/YeeE
MLHHQLPWYVGGPVLGLCVIALRLLLNARLGVTGAYTDVIDNVRRRSVALDWRGFFFVGLVVGGAAFALVAGGPDFHGYGWLTDTFHGSSGRILIAVLLLAAGVLIGYGSKTAGGCTSGNGLSGTSMLSPASLVATATFFGTAIAVSFVIEAVI